MQFDLAQAAELAIVVGVIALLVFTVVVAGFVLRLDRTVTELRRNARLTLGPVSERARRVSDNVEFITQALRTDVERLNASVQALTDRLQQASGHMEERIEEFNALMEVVQSEAEDIFLDTAATVRGVREGARSIAAPALERDRDGADVDEGDGDVDALDGTADVEEALEHPTSPPTAVER